MNVVNTKYGTLAVDEQNDAWFVKSLQKHDTQIDDIDVALSLVSKDSIVVDVGAHVGLFTIPLAKKVEHVYAIEPNKVSRGFLEQNIVDNGVASKVTVFPFVITNSKKNFLQSENLPNAETQYRENNSDQEGVLGNSLDTVVDKVDFIKIDVEGMEPEVLQGSSSLVDKWKPFIFIEINNKALSDHKYKRSDIECFFKKKKYNMYRVEDSKMHKLFSLNQSIFMNVLAVPAGTKIVATNPFIYFIKQIKRRIMTIVSGRGV